MPDANRAVIFGFAILAAMATSATKARAQASYAPPNDAPNPYQTVLNWGQLPDGRKWGSTAGVSAGPDGNIWAVDRCGANSCDGSTLDSILEFDPSGKLLKSFGGGLFSIPHGIFADSQGNVWVTDTGAKDGKGLQVVKFSAEGKELLRLGKAGIGGAGNDEFSQPSAVITAANGDIFVADGHTPTCGNSRIMKFDKTGKFIKSWGHAGTTMPPATSDEELTCPHALALDSRRRLYVADRNNNRVAIFDQDGKFIAAWKQFGRPSGIFIDKNDVLYVVDSESKDVNEGNGYGYNPGCHRGMRIGSVQDGKVTAFIPDPNPSGTTSAAEGVTVDPQGNIYGAEVGPKDVKKYVKKN